MIPNRRIPFSMSASGSGDILLSFDSPSDAKETFRAMRSFDTAVSLLAKPQYRIVVERKRWSILFAPYTHEVIGNRRYFVIAGGHIVPHENSEACNG